MVIQSSDVAMSSGRAYKRQTHDRSSVRTWGEVLNAATSPQAWDSRTITQRDTEFEAVELYQNYSSGGKLISFESKTGSVETNASVIRSEKNQSSDQQNVVTGNTKRIMTLREFFSYLVRKRQEDFKRFLESFGIGVGLVKRGETVYEKQEVEYQSEESEEEKTFVDTSGSVTTADGKKIEFDLSLFMERSYTSRSETAIEHESVRLTDPLVINFDSESATLGNKSFSFDIDSDGKLDNIAMLGRGCGFLALDRNEDGVINDGSELFGTKSGNGFKDLEVYDIDGNGWIDENDPIFDKLRIWSKAEDGTDQLVGLGLRGVGAVFLGNTTSNFSLTDLNNNTLGMIRSTGIFLREDGGAGTVQQVDLAKQYKAG